MGKVWDITSGRTQTLVPGFVVLYDALSYCDWLFDANLVFEDSGFRIRRQIGIQPLFYHKTSV